MFEKEARGRLGDSPSLSRISPATKLQSTWLVCCWLKSSFPSMRSCGASALEMQ